MQAFFAEVSAYIKERGADAAMAPYVTPLGQALGELQQATMWFVQNALGNPDNAGAGATDYMHLFGLVALGYMWCLIAEAAKAKRPVEERRGERMAQRLTTGRFFMERMLPATTDASRAHQGRRRQHHGIAAGGILAIHRQVLARRASDREEFMPDAFIYDHVRTPRGRGKVGRLAARSHRAQSGEPGARRHQEPQQSRHRSGR